jgi:hypothetical protein
MKMHEVMGHAHQEENNHPHTLTLTLDHNQVDQFRRLACDRSDMRVVQIDDIGNEKAMVSVTCVSTEIRDRLADAW